MVTLASFNLFNQIYFCIKRIPVCWCFLSIYHQGDVVWNVCLPSNAVRVKREMKEDFFPAVPTSSAAVIKPLGCLFGGVTASRGGGGDGWKEAISSVNETKEKPPTRHEGTRRRSERRTRERRVKRLRRIHQRFIWVWLKWINYTWQINPSLSSYTEKKPERTVSNIIIS